MLYYQAAKALKNKINNLKIIVTKADNVTFNLPNDIIVESDDIYGAMKYSKAAITTSGTASLECAIMDTPEVVCYKLSGMSYFITNLMNKSPFISMVNLIAGRMVVPEYLQNRVNQKNIIDALLPLLSDTAERKKMLEGMSEVRRSLGMPGVYDRAAEAILQRT